MELQTSEVKQTSGNTKASTERQVGDVTSGHQGSLHLGGSVTGKS